MKSLEKLEFDTVKEACGRWLTDLEIRNTLMRRDALVEYHKKLSDEKGFGIMFP